MQDPGGEEEQARLRARVEESRSRPPEQGMLGEQAIESQLAACVALASWGRSVLPRTRPDPSGSALSARPLGREELEKAATGRRKCLGL